MTLFRRRDARPGFAAAMHTDPGRVRRLNEDSCLVDTGRGLFAVADGMGGHPAGDVASRVAVEILPGLVDRALRAVDHHGASARDALERALVDLDAAVRAEADTSADLTGMGTTVVALLLSPGGACLGHVGDSRAYLLRRGELRRLTDDHSLGSELVRGGMLDAEQARRHPFAHRVTRAIGIAGTAGPDVVRVDLEAGDRVLLCSDGVTAMLPDPRVGEILCAHPQPAAVCRALVDAANDAGGRDNISAVVVAMVDP